MFQASATNCLSICKTRNKVEIRKFTDPEKGKVRNQFYERLDKKSFRCKICHFTTVGQMIVRHIRAEHPESIDESVLLECKICHMQFMTEIGYEMHMSKKHNSNNYSNYCDACKSYFAKDHICRKNRFPCDYCEKRFQSKQRVQEHTDTIHLGKTPFKCKKCTKKWASKYLLDKHFKATHCPQKCKICGTVCNHAFDLKRHMVIAHKQNNQAFQCHLCTNQVYFKKLNYARHMSEKHNMSID